MSSTVLDRFGRELQVGDQVYLVARQDIIWEVVQCAPHLHPMAPPGSMTLMLAATVPAVVPGGQPVMDVLLVLPAAPQEAQAQPPAPPVVEES